MIEKKTTCLDQGQKDGKVMDVLCGKKAISASHFGARGMLEPGFGTSKSGRC